MEAIKDSLKKQVELLETAVRQRELVILKIRQRITEQGWLPTSTKDLADLLEYTSKYYKVVGALERTKEILDGLIGGTDMTMEKYGVECQNVHTPDKSHMTKVGSDDYQCKHCGKIAKFASLDIADPFQVNDKLKAAKEEKK